MKTAYDNNLAIAERVRAQVQAHFDADEIIHGKYWENGERLRGRMYRAQLEAREVQ